MEHHSHKKERIWVSGSEVNEPRHCYREWNKSEREKQISYINAYVWNLEKWYWWIYMQGKNGDKDVEDGLVVKVWEGEGGVNLESNVDMYTLSV